MAWIQRLPKRSVLHFHKGLQIQEYAHVVETCEQLQIRKHATPATCRFHADEAVKKILNLYKEVCLVKALQCLDQLYSQGLKSASFIYVGLLQECSRTKALEDGKQVHAHILKLGFESDIFVANALMRMYTRCDNLVEAVNVFVNMSCRTLVSWNTLISGYAKQANYRIALTLVRQMKLEGLVPDGRTFVNLLIACANAGAVHQGKQIHIDIINSGYGTDIVVLNAIIYMYIRCNCPRDAREVFDSIPKRDVISFTTVIGRCIKHGEAGEALKLFHQMRQEGVKADGQAFVYVLNACATLKALEYGKQVHAEILENGLIGDIYVGNALIHLYAQCGSLEQAREILMSLPRRDVVSWTTIVTGFVKHKRFSEAIELCKRMKQEGLKLDKVTYVSLLNACANIPSLEEGKQVHFDILNSGIEKDIFLSNALIDMYGKCGSLKDARKVFDEMAERDTVSWTAMIASYTTHGDGAEAFRLFRLMQHESVQPDEVTFVSVLTGCSHIGLLDEGCSLFESMFVEYKLTPMLEHYGCMIDLFCRSGRLEEAYDYLRTMPLSPDVKLWKTLLGACRVHGNLKLAESVTKHILHLQPQESAAYVVLSSMYAAAGKLREKGSLRLSMDERGVKKEPAYSIVQEQVT